MHLQIGERSRCSRQSWRPFSILHRQNRLTRNCNHCCTNHIGVRMAHSLSDPPMGGLPAAQSYTLKEILQQPALWPTTVERVRAASNRLRLSELLRGARVVLTGAGTSFYAASAIAAAWPGAVAISTTDLLIDAERYLIDVGVLIFLTRSGNSPESA